MKSAITRGFLLLLALLLCAGTALAKGEAPVLRGTLGSALTLTWTQAGGSPDEYRIRLYKDGELAFERALSGRCRRYRVTGCWLRGADELEVRLQALVSGQYSDAARWSSGEKPSGEKPSATVTPQADPINSMAAEVVRQVNEEREKQGLSSLRVDSELTRAACVRASEIVESFSHTRPDGTRCFTVSSSAYGENIAKGQSSADRVMAAWMSSQGHRENILRASYGSIGVCAIRVDGVYYWVQLFGK